MHANFEINNDLVLYRSHHITILPHQYTSISLPVLFFITSSTSHIKLCLFYIPLGAVLMLLLAPSTASELEIGKLDLKLLNSWLNEAEKLEISSKNDESRSNSDHPNYFKHLSEKFEEYYTVLEKGIEDGKFNGIISRSTVDDEKMGEDWNAMISKEEKIENQNNESYNENILDLKDVDQARTYTLKIFIHFLFSFEINLFSTVLCYLFLICFSFYQFNLIFHMDFFS